MVVVLIVLILFVLGMVLVNNLQIVKIVHIVLVVINNHKYLMYLKYQYIVTNVQIVKDVQEHNNKPIQINKITKEDFNLVVPLMEVQDYSY